MNKIPTDDQKKAIESRSKRVSIIAGPGSGKTFVIIQRILFFIECEKFQPEEILAITFTNKAANEMMERLRRKIKRDVLGVHISTIHSFCNTILKEYSDSYDSYNQFDILDEIMQFLFIFHHSEELEADSIMDEIGRSSKGSLIRDLVNYFNLLKNNNISPKLYFNKCKDSYYTSQGNFQNRELKVRYLIAKTYMLYCNLLKENNYLDFGDLIQFSVNILKEKQELRNKISDKYKCILIDEYQDSNRAQIELIKLIISNETHLTIVGDDDQSIYRFRGAEVDSIKQFKGDFAQNCDQHIDNHVLTMNHRSTPEIVNISSRFIDKLTKRINKNLYTENDSGDFPSHYEANGLQDEADFICQKILELKSKNKINDFSDVALLFRSLKRYSKYYTRQLEEYNIPFEIVRAENLFDFELINNFVNFLLFLSKRENDGTKVEIEYLVNSIGTLILVSDETLKILNDKMRNNLELNSDDICNQADKEIILRLFEFKHDYLNKKIKAYSLLDLFYRIIKITGLITKEKIGINDRQIYLIAQLSNYIYNYERITCNKNLSGLLSFLGSIKNLGYGFDVKGSFKNSIKLMTVHQAKGLEFPVVFIPNMVNKRFPIEDNFTSKYFRLPIEFDSTAKKNIIRKILTQEDFDPLLEEEMRLFYVAMTRAKYFLFLTNSKQINGKTRNKSSFIEESKDFFYSVDHPRINFMNPILESNFLPQFDSNLSYSKLKYYLNCGLRYKFKFIYDFSTPLNWFFSYGISLHNTLRDIHKKIKDNEPYDYSEIFEKNWISDGYFDDKHEIKNQIRGKERIKTYLSEYSRKLEDSILEVEKRFAIIIADFQFTGIIDLIIKDNTGGYVIFDFKAGSQDIQYLKSPQLAIYSFAAINEMKIKISKQYYHFLGDNKRLAIKTEDNEFYINEVKKILEKIKSFQFPPNNLKEICRECEFHHFCPYITQ